MIINIPNDLYSRMKPIVVCNLQIITYFYAHTDPFQTPHLHLSAIKHLIDGRGKVGKLTPGLARFITRKNQAPISRARAHPYLAIRCPKVLSILA